MGARKRGYGFSSNELLRRLIPYVEEKQSYNLQDSYLRETGKYRRKRFVGGDNSLPGGNK